MPAREEFYASLRALSEHVDRGEIRDTAMPNTRPHEAMRLIKNGVTVASFAAFEDFLRRRMRELLDEISSSPYCPPFAELPDGLRVAATSGAVEALRSRTNPRTGIVSGEEALAEIIAQCKVIGRLDSQPYSFPPHSFGFAGSNLTAGSIQDFFQALQAQRRYDQIGPLATSLGLDLGAADLAPDGRLQLKRLFSWRHSAAHNAQMNIDIETLQTRLNAYLTIAAAIDALASHAAVELIRSFQSMPQNTKEKEPTIVRLEFPHMDGSHSCAVHGLPMHVAATLPPLYSAKHAAEFLGELSLPWSWTIVAREGGWPREWFFC